ncbi:MAG: hypothetical protein ACOC3Z_02000 [Nanoarchaeota archaeon]
MLGWIILIIGILILILMARIKTRGYFWKDKKGKEIDAKEFASRWREGIQGVTPLQQKKVSLWSMIPLFAGIFWGIIITLMGKTYWLCLILCASLPLTTINLISTLQQYWSIKKVQEVMEELE